MFHWILLGLPKENPIVLMVALVVYQINPNTELQRNEKNIIWSFKNFGDLKLILKYLYSSKVVKVSKILENKHNSYVHAKVIRVLILFK